MKTRSPRSLWQRLDKLTAEVFRHFRANNSCQSAVSRAWTDRFCQPQHRTARLFSDVRSADFVPGQNALVLSQLLAGEQSETAANGIPQRIGQPPLRRAIRSNSTVYAS